MKENIAIVTGATGGLGREFVKLLSQKDDIKYVFSIGRNKSKIDNLKECFGKKIVTYQIDLSDREKIKEFEKELNGYTIKYLVNNAGFAKFCSWEDLNVDESLAMIDVNISAVVSMCRICIPYMENGSKIINIASQASFQPLPYLNIYAATKAFVRSYTRALNEELKVNGISATAVCPGWIDTGLFDVGDIGAKKAPTKFYFMTEPQKVAKKAIKDADKNKDMSVCTIPVKFQHIGAKLLPQKLIMKIWELSQKF